MAAAAAREVVVIMVVVERGSRRRQFSRAVGGTNGGFAGAGEGAALDEAQRQMASRADATSVSSSAARLGRRAGGGHGRTGTSSGHPVPTETLRARQPGTDRDAPR